MKKPEQQDAKKDEGLAKKLGNQRFRFHPGFLCPHCGQHRRSKTHRAHISVPR